MTIDKTNLLAALRHSRPDDADAPQPEGVADRESRRVEDDKDDAFS